jgi:catechol 2,3-dioxygenase-like lactoylglutathione lyase family enzyme
MTTFLMAVVAAAAIGVTSGQGLPSAKLEYRPQVTVQLAVSSLDRSVQFYEGILGFKVTERRDDLKFAHVATNVPGLELGINEVAAPAVSRGVVINISVTDVAAGRTALEGKGVKFAGPTAVIPGKVALAEFADPDGHRLRLAGPPPR